MNKILLFLLVILSALHPSIDGHAQVINEHLSELSKPKPLFDREPDTKCKEEEPKDPSIWDKSIHAGFNYTEGNTKISNLNLNGKLARDYQNNAWRFEADYNYGSASNNPDEPREETRNSLRFLGDYKRIIDDRWFAGSGASFFRDEIADLKYRTILNSGLGTYLLRDDDVRFTIEAGPAYVWEKKGNDEDNYLAPRIANRIDWKLSETASVFQWTEYLVSANDVENYLINAEAGIEAALNSYLSLVLSVRDNYINQPAAGRVRNDVATITALKVTL